MAGTRAIIPALASCSYCGLDGLKWSENVNDEGKHWLYNENTGQEHLCPRPIDIMVDYVIQKSKVKGVPDKRYDLGFKVPLGENTIAHLIVKEALRCGLNPYTVRTERRGNQIILH